MQLRIEAGVRKYSISTEHKVTVIEGMSATGKSQVFNALASVQAGAGTIRGISIDDIFAVAQYIGGGFDSLIRGSSAKLFFLDIDELPFDNSVAAEINKKQAFFVLFGRRVPDLIPVHMMAVQIFEYRSGVNTSIPKYANAVKLGLTPGLRTFVEDAGGGLQFYRAVFNSKAESTEGCAGIPAAVSGATEQRVQLIADAAILGNVLGRVHPLDKLVVFAPECFESVIAHSAMFHVNDSMFIKNREKYKSSEDFYTRALSEQIKTTGEAYSKSRLHKCLANSCAFCVRRCALFNKLDRPLALWESSVLNKKNGELTQVPFIPSVRQLRAVSAIRSRGYMLVSEYARMCGVTDTVSRAELNELVGYGFLRKTRRSNYNIYEMRV